VEVQLNHYVATGEAPSRKQAESAAAKRLYEALAVSAQ
jgi:dsRNA-specific ribonuclease